MSGKSEKGGLFPYFPKRRACEQSEGDEGFLQPTFEWFWVESDFQNLRASFKSLDLYFFKHTKNKWGMVCVDSKMSLQMVLSTVQIPKNPRCREISS